jgi:hypothetical protein
MSPPLPPDPTAPPQDSTPPPVFLDPVPPQPQDDTPSPTLSELEAEVKSSEQEASNEADGLDNARDEVSRALNTAESTLPPKPIEALNAQPMADNLNSNVQTEAPAQEAPIGPTLAEILTDPKTTKPPSSTPETPRDNSKVIDPTAPPPVPPPIPFQFGQNPPQQ